MELEWAVSICFPSTDLTVAISRRRTSPTPHSLFSILTNANLRGRRPYHAGIALMVHTRKRGPDGSQPLLRLLEFQAHESEPDWSGSHGGRVRRRDIAWLHGGPALLDPELSTKEPQRNWTQEVMTSPDGTSVGRTSPTPTCRYFHAHGREPDGSEPEETRTLSDVNGLASAKFSPASVYNQWTVFPAGFNPAAAGLRW